MRIHEVIRRKGDTVVTIPPRASVNELLALLAEHGIGAVVVSEDGRTVAGIVSERDVVRHLHTAGPEVLEQPVSAIMTTEVHACAPEDELESLARTMTEHRVRHLPVVVDGRLRAIVSIGDVVKHRMSELESEKDALEDYIRR